MFKFLLPATLTLVLGLAPVAAQQGVASCQVLEDQLAGTQDLLENQIAQTQACDATLADLHLQLGRRTSDSAVQQCEGQIASALDEVDAIAEQLDLLLGERSGLIAQNADLQENLADAEARVQEQAVTLTDLEQINRSLQRTINQIQDDNAAKDAQQADILTENTRLQTELNAARRSAEDHRERADQCAQDLTALATLLATQGGEGGQVPGDGQDPSQDMLVLQQELEQAQAEASALSDQVTALKAQAADQAAEIADLKAILAAEP